MTGLAPPATAWEYLTRAFDPPPAPRWATPGDLALAVEPATVQTAALDLVDAALVDVDAGRCDRLIVCMPPQEGKSTRITKAGPLWMLTRNPERRLGIVSYAQPLAEDFSRDVRDMITSNSGDEGTLDLGLRIARDNGAARRWKLDGHKGGLYAVGIEGGLTGRPLDGLIIDDPIAKQEQADSAAYRDHVWKWWQAVGGRRLAPGGFAIIVLTRWHQDDIAGRALAAPDGYRWRVINIPAQAEHNPDDGQSDILGRRPGEYLASTRRRTIPQWEQIKVESGSRVWSAMYQGRPAPVEGGILKRRWWRRYDTPRAMRRNDGTMWHPGPGRLITSWDMAFKGTDTSDFVAGQVWAVDGADAYLLDQVCDRLSFVETLQAFVDMARTWPQATAHYIEDKANGPAVLSMLRTRIPGLIPVEPDGSKTARANAVAPMIEAGNVHLPADHLAPWIDGFLTECDGFPYGAHDDQVDAMSQALSRTLLTVRPSTDSTEWFSLTRRRTG